MNSTYCTTCWRRSARQNASHPTCNSCISSRTLTGLCALFPALSAPRDGPRSVRHLRYQVRPRYILITLRLDSFCVFFLITYHHPFISHPFRPTHPSPPLHQHTSHSRMLTRHFRYVTQNSRIYLGRGLIFRSPPYAALFLRSNRKIFATNRHKK